MKLTTPVSGDLIDVNLTGNDQRTDYNLPVGCLLELADRRNFRFGRVGAANISAGKLELAPAPIANHGNLTVAATPSGSLVVPVTPGATAGNAGIYAEGYMFVNAGPGAGQQYLIGQNPAIVASTQFNLQLIDQILTALTASSKVTLVHNAHSALREAAVQTARAAGVPLVNLTAGYQGWTQTKGEAAVLADQAIPLGSWLVPSASVAGAVIAASGTYATAVVTNMLGQADIVAGVDTEYRPVVLSID